MATRYTIRHTGADRLAGVLSAGSADVSSWTPSRLAMPASASTVVPVAGGGLPKVSVIRGCR